MSPSTPRRARPRYPLHRRTLAVALVTLMLLTAGIAAGATWITLSRRASATESSQTSHSSPTTIPALQLPNFGLVPATGPTKNIRPMGSPPPHRSSPRPRRPRASDLAADPAYHRSVNARCLLYPAGATLRGATGYRHPLRARRLTPPVCHPWLSPTGFCTTRNRSAEPTSPSPAPWSSPGSPHQPVAIPSQPGRTPPTAWLSNAPRHYRSHRSRRIRPNCSTRD